MSHLTLRRAIAGHADALTESAAMARVEQLGAQVESLRLKIASLTAPAQRLAG